jgi:hypothetical protein
VAPPLIQLTFAKNWNQSPIGCDDGTEYSRVTDVPKKVSPTFQLLVAPGGVWFTIARVHYAFVAPFSNPASVAGWLVWLIVVPEISVAEPHNCGAPTRGAIARVRVGPVGGLTVDPLMSHFTVPFSPAVQCNPLSRGESDGPA